MNNNYFIFVTVGSTNFQFNRLFSSLDEYLVNKNVHLVAQTGNSQYKWRYKNINIYNYLEPKKIIYFINFLRTLLPSHLKNYFVANKKIAAPLENYLIEVPQKNNLSKYIFLESTRERFIHNLGQFIEKSRTNHTY